MIWAVLLGYLIGSIPSADVIARRSGHDLRSAGSRNPGTANALRVAGRKVAAIVLAIDIAKGATSVLVGSALAGAAGSVGAGVAAVAGQVLNPWFRFKGGKGLGVTAGVTAVAWPPGLLVVLPFAAGGAKFLRAAGGAILGLIAYLFGAILWAENDWATPWGAPTDDGLVWLAIGVAALTAPRFIGDLTRSRRIDTGRLSE